MTRNEAKILLQAELPDKIWQRDRTRRKYPGYICPICNSGNGTNGTGISTKDGIHYSCWTGCFSSQDVISIVGMVYNIKNYNAQLKKCCELYGLDYNSLEIEAPGAITTRKAQPEQKPLIDYTFYFQRVAQTIEKTDYLIKRGISYKTQKAYNIGYDESWTHPTGNKDFVSKRIIIPTSKYSYVARATEESKSPKLKAGQASFFNSECMRGSSAEIIITEGEIDALSFLEVGFTALSIGSVTMVDKFAETIPEQAKDKIFLIALDNDNAGESAAKKLHSKLNEKGIENYIINPHKAYKDANEALQAGREAFKDKCKEAIENIKKEALEAEKEALKEYKETYSTANYREAFENEIEENANTDTIKTGFPALDKAINGGLFKGLYIVGGISSVGKTTLCLQIADNIATSQQDVIVFSLEMARAELMAKSISRNTYLLDLEMNGSTQHAKTTTGILYGKNRENYNSLEKRIISESKSLYFENTAPNLYIYEGQGKVTAQTIRDAIHKHISFTGNKPVVIIDYLQIIAPIENGVSDKQSIDRTITELKRLSRDYNIPVICVSSFNRDSYKTNSVNNGVATMADFKESGTIEYSADVLLALQFQTAGTNNYNEQIEKGKQDRKIKLVVLKNRNGAAFQNVSFTYYPAFNYIEEQ